MAIFTKKHHRSPSHFNLKYGRENSPPDSPVREMHPINSIVANGNVESSKEGAEVAVQNCNNVFVLILVFFTGRSKCSPRILNVETEAKFRQIESIYKTCLRGRY